VTKIMLGEKYFGDQMKLGEWSDRQKATVVTDDWLRFVASGKFPLLASLDLSWCNNITETGILLN
jgi:hypothetical protein